jgi:hypothetical protein
MGKLDRMAPRQLLKKVEDESSVQRMARCVGQSISPRFARPKYIPSVIAKRIKK